ncbi:uncharacterized protein N7483_003654 [Penicillium malachiteum]|uniref:uncharacterized protein n=1 Tax=Penicillium malachiteum TaxID=1324776 RepID=UPI0025473EEC|nr:uncharacterized protein N7483_003654 [Penicillium malachiteum]KAJ5729146.1 hypothetical protein N7483_003654 [Penicillium malachiteum]
MASVFPQRVNLNPIATPVNQEALELGKDDHQQSHSVPVTSQTSADPHSNTQQLEYSEILQWHRSHMYIQRGYDDIEMASEENLRIPPPREASITNDHTSEDGTGEQKHETHPMPTFPVEAIRENLKEPAIKRFLKYVRGIFSPKRVLPLIVTYTAEFYKEKEMVDAILQSAQVTLPDDDRAKVNTHLGILSQHAPAEWIDSLYRHNLLYSRAKLYQLVLELRPTVHPDGPAASGQEESGSFNRMKDIKQALADYSNAMDTFKAFRKEPGEIRSDQYIMTLAGMLTELDKKRGQTKLEETHQLSTSRDKIQQEETAQQPSNDIAVFEAQIANLLVNGAKFSSAGVRTEEESKARLDFLSRLVMALFGGAALIVPMLIMTLHPSKLNSLLTTSLFVVGVAVILAWFMKDAAPKDILGATAAYAAVLVVFVGTG